MTTYLRTNQASLYLDTLLCTGRTTDSAGNVFTIRSMADAASWGAPQPIDVAVQRWMTDGAVASTQGYENREITFVVKVSAANSTALAAGEAALTEAARAATQLIWVPPEGNVAPETVFDIWTCHLSHAFELDEENRFTRTYQVTCTARPWARSANLVTVPAVPTAAAGSTTASVDAGTSTTGWTATQQRTGSAETAATLSVFSATAIRQSYTFTSADVGNFKSVFLRATRTGSVTGLATTPYLAIDYRPSPYTPYPTVTVDGQACTYIGASGTVRYFRVPVGMTSFTTLAILSTIGTNSNMIGATLNVDIYDITRSSIGPITATHRMLNRNLDTGGSVKTNGSIQVASPSATLLGNTLVYSGPKSVGSYSPPLRQYRISGGSVTADTTMVSGAREIISNSTMVYSIPAGALRPATYAVVGRFPFSAAANINVQFSTVYPGSATPTLVDTLPVYNLVTTAAATIWAVLGLVTLPPVAQPTESAVATGVRLQGFTGSASTLLDELFLLDVTNGSFSLVTMVSPATSTSPSTFTRLWFDSPDATNGPPQVYYGANADRSDAARVHYTQIMSMGDHDLDPDGAMIFTVTDNVDDAVVTATYYQRWHTNAAL